MRCSALSHGSASLACGIIKGARTHTHTHTQSIVPGRRTPGGLLFFITKRNNTAKLYRPGTSVYVFMFEKERERDREERHREITVKVCLPMANPHTLTHWPSRTAGPVCWLQSKIMIDGFNCQHFALWCLYA